MTNPWKFRIISINVNGLKSNMWTKLRQLHRARYDIIMMQETKLLGDDDNDNLIYRWGQVSDGEAFTSPAAASQAGGVAILLSASACERLTDRDQVPISSDKHRHIMISARLNEKQVYIHSIYAPVNRTNRPEFFNNLTIPATTGSHLIGGDFNCVVDAQLDTIGDANIATSGTTELMGWIAALDATDAWRTRNSDRQEFTSPSGNSRIDMIFVTGCFADNYTAKHAPRTIGSDHMCPEATTSSAMISDKGGHWQMPIWIAHKAARRIKPVLEDLTTSTDQTDYPTIFKRTMMTVTGLCQATHKTTLQQRKEKIDIAKLRWIRAHMKAVQSPCDVHIADAVETRRLWLKEVEERERTRRAREFDKHFREAERCTAFFLRRPSAKSATNIPGVKLSDNTITHDQHIIQQEHRRFWSTLYSTTSGGSESAPTTANINALLGTDLPKLTTAAAQTLEAPITTEDIEQQIARLPKNKAAGADGLRAELFKCSPTLWAKALLPIFEKFLHNKRELPKSFRESIIILLFKKGCPLNPRNYRPIALLNVMAKILSGILNNRLRKVLESIIPPEQTGFVPNRSISENVILLQDAVYYAKRHHPSSIIVSLDFEKAYDRVQRPVMIKIMEKMGFGPRWMTTIATMYKSRDARLSINGDLTHPFPIDRGVLQGDPLSPALFIIQCSPLYAALQQQRHRHGIPLPHGKFAPVATFYADDTNLIAKSPDSAIQLYNIAEWFCANSGAKLHPDKCVAIATGQAPPTLQNGIKVLDHEQYTTILGVPMGSSITRHQQTGKVIHKMLATCAKWLHIGRSIEGKVTIVRAMIVSTIWYILGALPTSRTEAEKLQRVVNNYINGAAQSDIGEPAARGNMSNKWFYIQQHLGGWGLEPIAQTLRVRKLSLMRKFMSEVGRETAKPWHAFIIPMIEEHVGGWGKDWKTLMFWNADRTQSAEGNGRWKALSPWWRDAWNEWLKLRLMPRKNSITRDQLAGWPIWNNHVLSSNHGINGALHRAFSNTDTRAHMKAIREQGFVTFRDFMYPNGGFMCRQDLYNSITVSLSVHESDHVVPQWACGVLLRTISALWNNATRKWLLTTHSTAQVPSTNWWTDGTPPVQFTKASNKLIRKHLRRTEPQTTQPKLIKVGHRHVTIDWRREASALKQLAPSRRDLMLRLVRNGLPVGSKRVHWPSATQTKCMLCSTDAVEHADHLFWSCEFAREVWGNLAAPWRNHRQSAVTWKEILCGYEIRLDHARNTTIEQLWSIIRACTIRVIWLERNRRYFYPSLQTRTAAYRRNLGMDDMKAHIASWWRRCRDDEKTSLVDTLNYLAAVQSEYNTLQVNASSHINNTV